GTRSRAGVVSRPWFPSESTHAFRSGAGSLMPLKIKQDHSRFREIIRGRIKENLREYIQKGEMIGKKGKDLITIPVPYIDRPHFRYGHKEKGGVGQGDGA